MKHTKLTVPEHKFKPKGEPLVYHLEGTDCIVRIHNSEFKDDHAKALAHRLAKAYNGYKALRQTLEERKEYWEGYSDAEYELAEGKCLLTSVRQAAPDMLAALKIAIEVIDDSEAIESGEQFTDRMHEAIMQMRAAIAKTKGEK